LSVEPFEWRLENEAMKGYEEDKSIQKGIEEHDEASEGCVM
jgi:hypothetical protein